MLTARRRVLGVCALAAVATAPGQTLVVGLFQPSLGEALGLDATALATAYLIATLTSAGLMTQVGRGSDWIGPPRVMALAAVGLGITCACIGQVRGPISLTVAFLGLRLFGQGALMLGSAHTLALWFDRRLGTAEGLRGTALYLGFAAMPALVLALIDQLGWRLAYAALGGAGALIVAPLALTLGRPTPVRRSDPAAGVSGYTLPQAWRTWAFWPLLGLLVSVALVITALLFHLRAVLEEAGGTAATTGLGLTLNTLAAGGATLVGGWMADRVDERRLLWIGGLCSGGAIASLGIITGTAPILGAMMIGGIGQGLIMNIGGTAMARWYGRAHHGAIRGFAASVTVAGTAVGPVLLSAFHDVWGSWSPALVIFGGTIAGVATLSGLTPRPQAPPSAPS